MAKSAAKKVAQLEDICIGAGFLLKKLRAQYGQDFGYGMDEQVRQCIRDCDQVGRAMLQRAAASTHKPPPPEMMK